MFGKSNCRVCCVTRSSSLAKIGIGDFEIRDSAFVDAVRRTTEQILVQHANGLRLKASVESEHARFSALHGLHGGFNSNYNMSVGLEGSVIPFHLYHPPDILHVFYKHHIETVISNIICLIRIFAHVRGPYTSCW